MRSIKPESFGDLEKSFGVFCGNHRFKEFPFAVAASEVAMASCYTNRRKSGFSIWKGIVMIGNRARNGKRELVVKMALPNPESFGLEFVQRGLNELSKHEAPKNGMME
jgi:hypothetical protein